MLSVKNLVKIYHSKKAKDVKALNNVSIDFPETGLVFLLGKSGSGKSTLLNTIGGLDKFDSGEIIIKGKSSKEFSGSDFDSYRNTFIGFIFQEYNILEEFTVSKNIALALELQGKKADKEEIDNLLEKVDMLSYANRKPNELSGGQKQRVAIARALIKNPEIIMADEPTGALDSNTGKQVMETLKKLSKTKLVIIVSHDRDFAETYGDRIVELKDGKIIRDVTKKEVPSTETKSGIKVIGNKIIYIKKGQEISEQELKNITKIINEQSKNADTFISFDEQGNEKLKEGAKINDNGNKENFVDTVPEDINLKQYNSKSLKLIKSKLKFKDSFKIGASSLKHKKVKLFFTILLSLIAFTLFGLTDTFASFNKHTSICETLETKKQYLLSIDSNRTINEGNYSYDENVKITEKQINELKTEIGINAYPVAQYNYSLNLNSQTENSNYMNSYDNPYFASASGMMALNSTSKSDLGLDFVSTSPVSKLPSIDSEICITKHLADCFIKKYSTITSYNDIIGKTTNNYTIVGIIDDKTDFSRYDKLENSNNRMDSSNQSLRMEISSLQEYGLSNVIFVTENVLAENSLKSEARYYYGKNTQDIYFYETTSNNTYNSLSGTDLATLNSKIKFKDGITSINQLTDDQIILTNYQFSSYISNEIGKNITNIFDDGEVFVTLYNDYGCNDKFATFEIVGVMTDSSFRAQSGNYISISSNIVNQNTFNNYFSGYKFSIANVKNYNGLKELTNYIKDLENNKVRIHIQSPYTFIIDNFGDTIESISHYILYVAIGFAIFSGILLANYISTSISYKKREIGILRAIGARSNDVFKIFFNESFLIAFINYVLSVFATIIACFFINKSIINSLGFNVTLLTFGVRQIVLMFLVSLVVAFVASFFPVRKIARKKPVDAINNR